MCCLGFKAYDFAGVGGKLGFRTEGFGRLRVRGIGRCVHNGDIWTAPSTVGPRGLAAMMTVSLRIPPSMGHAESLGPTCSRRAKGPEALKSARSS